DVRARRRDGGRRRRGAARTADRRSSRLRRRGSSSLAMVRGVTHRIALIPGDGAGPEVVAEARKVVDALGLELEWTELPWGSAYYREHGAMMPPDALDVVRRHDAVFLGAVGDPSVPDDVTLWGLLLTLRQGLDLWANLRPARLLDGVPSPLAGAPPVDMLFVRENT